MKLAPERLSAVRHPNAYVLLPSAAGRLYSATSNVPVGLTAVTYATWPKGGATRGQTATAPTRGTVPVKSPCDRAIAGQLYASIRPATNQSVRWWFASSAHATYEVQLHSYISQRSTVSAGPEAGQECAYG